MAVGVSSSGLSEMEQIETRVSELERALGAWLCVHVLRQVLLS